MSKTKEFGCVQEDCPHFSATAEERCSAPTQEVMAEADCPRLTEAEKKVLIYEYTKEDVPFELAKLANTVQNACNLSGVVHSFDKVVSKIWDLANAKKKGTDWVNHHPVTVMFVYKLCDLCDAHGEWDKAEELVAEVLLEGETNAGASAGKSESEVSTS